MLYGGKRTKHIRIKTGDAVRRDIIVCKAFGSFNRPANSNSSGLTINRRGMYKARKRIKVGTTKGGV